MDVAFVDVAFGRCADIFAALTQEQRSSHRAIAFFDAGALGDEQLSKLRSQGLIHIDAFGITLTANGRVIASFC